MVMEKTSQKDIKEVGLSDQENEEKHVDTCEPSISPNQEPCVNEEPHKQQNQQSQHQKPMHPKQLQHPQQHQQHQQLQSINIRKFERSENVKKEVEIPYSVREIEKSIMYYSRTCGEYEYASVLEKYSIMLQRYNVNKNLFVPVYPDFIKYKYPEKRYKRPAHFQNAGRTTSFTNKKVKELPS